ncbi:hypothetical protein [Hyalangium sp.]|uniref:hypothetical protein n=1 Tax=Hyalangium sp. TaxID=2028555 RepID=UPI002D314EDE|nr:hypothetical protein [Hyalangium sp.]HYI02907.1 hypothetical protein [Hyalangium sp.]
MSSSENPPGTPPPSEAPPPAPPPSGSGFPKAILIALITVVVSGVAVGAFVLGRRTVSPGSGTLDGPASSGPGTPSAGATVEGMPPPPPMQPMSPPTQGTPAVWVDVYQPAKVRNALVENPWLQEQLRKPLGQGFASSWAAFFGSTGEDLKASFKGAVFDVVAGQILDSPFRALWFAGGSDTNAPTFIVPTPSGSAVAAYEAMEKVASRGGFTADKCPSGASASITPPEGGFKIVRWLVAEQSLYAARTTDRLVVARQPSMVLRGLCTELVKQEAPPGVDLELGFNSEVLGRETVFLTHALGLANGTRLQFGAEGTRLVARGITGPLMDKVRLDAAPLSDDLLKLVPADTPVLLALQLKLPESLEGSKIGAYWKGEDPGQVRTRQIALLWTPRGDADLGHEFAILWGRVEDAPALETMFNGGNPLVKATLCKHQVLASEPEVLQRLQKACEGKSPNLLNAAGPVVQGLRAPGSVTIGLNTGHLLSQLLADGYWSEQQLGKNAPVTGSAPPEIEAARKDLETLPYVGLRGTVQGNSLVPGGFGS